MSLKVICSKDYINKKNEIEVIVSSFFSAGKLIEKGQRNIVKSNFLGQEEINIKYFKKPNFLNSIIYSFFRKSKAKRSFEYASYLKINDISTPKPIAFIERFNTIGLLTDSYYISQQIEYDFTIRELIHDPLFENRILILEKFTEFSFKMHEANINFLDHSPGNTLIKKSGNDYIFYLIDLNRMKFEYLSIENRMDNLKKMWLSRQMVQIIAKKYADLSNQSEEKIYEILLQKSQQFKRKITRKKYLKRKINK